MHIYGHMDIVFYMSIDIYRSIYQNLLQLLFLTVARLFVKALSGVLWKTMWRVGLILWLHHHAFH